MDTYKDFRKLLERKDIDAVCIATPDHWHAIQTIMACQAGKDVYVEKPLTITIKEGRKRVRVAKKTNWIVQIGLNRRGSTNYQYLAHKVKNGLIGKVTVIRAARISNMFPNGIGNKMPEEPPANFNWDIWLGPQAKVPYQYNMAPYFFRWWSDYSSQMGNCGVHYLDVIRWLTGEQAPVAVSAHGGQFALKNDRTIPDAMEVFFEFESGMILQFSIHEACGGRLINDGEIEFRGTKASLVTSDRTFKITPKDGGQFQDRGALMDEQKYQMQKDEDINSELVGNLLDCIKSRDELWCPLETGHRSTTFVHLVNIALKMEKYLESNPKQEKFINCEKANELLYYEYRKPWKLGYFLVHKAAITGLGFRGSEFENRNPDLDSHSPECMEFANIKFLAKK